MSLPEDDDNYIAPQYPAPFNDGRTLPSVFLGPPRYPKQLQRRLEQSGVVAKTRLDDAYYRQTYGPQFGEFPETDKPYQPLRPLHPSFQDRPARGATLESVASRTYQAPNANALANVAANMAPNVANMAPTMANMGPNMANMSSMANMANMSNMAPNMHGYPLIDEGLQLDQMAASNIEMEYPNDMLRRELDMDAQNKKVAPRSIDLFRVGPPFGATTVRRQVYCDASGAPVVPVLNCRIDRGFELGPAGNWIGYKRNYFTLVLTFRFEDYDLDKFAQNTYHIDDKGRRRVLYFALGISVRCNDPEVNIGLVQHTPKRDKGPQYPTPVYPAVPGGDLPEHQTVKASCNKRNSSKIASLSKIFGFSRDEYYREKGIDKDEGVLAQYPTGTVTKVARFERIQFTASLRVKVNNVYHKHFILSVELLGYVDNGDQVEAVVLATTETPPLIVRGRSPSNYHVEKTSGYRGDQYTEDQM